MKRLLFIVILLSSCKPTPQTFPSEKLPWLKDWESAVTQSKKNQKPLLIEVAVEWCPSCKFIDERIFSQSQVVERIQQFILLRIDGDLASNQKFMEQRHVHWYPTFLVLAPDGKEQARFSEIVSSADFIEILNGVTTVQPGFKELGQARVAEGEDNRKEAKQLYEQAAALFRSQNHPALEEALVGIVRLTIDENPKPLMELVKKFPDSVAIPEFHKKMADQYTSEPLKRDYLMRAIKILEGRLDKLALEDFSAEQLVVDVDLLADLYEEMSRHAEIAKLYLGQARRLEGLMKKTGGATHNRHLISNISYLYRKAGEPKKALSFLQRVQKELPTYWPVYHSYAKVYQDLDDFEKATQAASRAYELALEVAKSRCALTWADCETSRKNYQGAVTILQKGISDLKTFSAASGRAPNHMVQGRAKKMLAKLEARIAELHRYQGLLP